MFVIGAFPRFYNITTQGLVRWDEGAYLLDASSLSHMNDHGKPLHVLLTWLSIQLFGFNDYAGKLVSAFLATLTIVIVYILGKKLYNGFVGLASAILIALSYNHIYFSRLGHAQADSSFFLALGVCLYATYRIIGKGNIRYIGYSGFSLGLAFTCHPNVFPFVLFFAASELFFVTHQVKLTKKISDITPLLVLGFFMALPLLLMELFSSAFETSYFSRLLYHASIAIEGPYNDYLYYVRQIRDWEGVSKLILVITGFCFFLVLAVQKKMSRSDTFVLCFALFPILFWTLDRSTGDTDRNYTPMLIGINLLVARFMCEAVRQFKGLRGKGRSRKTVILSSACVLVLLITMDMIRYNVSDAYGFMNEKGAYLKLVQQIRAIDSGPIIMPDIISPAIKFYFLKDDHLITCNSVNEAEPYFHKAGARHFLIPLYRDSIYPEMANTSIRINQELSLNGQIEPVLSFGKFKLYDLGKVYRNARKGITAMSFT